MKTKLLYLFIFLLGISSMQAQETTVNLTMNPGYTNQVYYKLSTETETSVDANSWDIAMMRTTAFDFGIRVNAGIEVFEAANTPSDWSTIDVANEASWTPLYDSETSWKDGAFMSGSATFGIGEYQGGGVVAGTIIYVLKYADGSYKKIIFEQYYYGYTFKYSSWDGTNWSADQTVSIPNTTNPNNAYNFYSLRDNQEVIVEPARTDWDFVFRRYVIDYFGDGSTYYPVTGVLHNDLVEVAQNDEPSGMPANPTLDYSTDINIIGHDWKAFTGGSFVVYSNQAYYIKYEDDTIYRLYFTAFEGSTTGNLSFNFEDITSTLGIEDVTESVSFGVYPNPSLDKKINLVYDNKFDANNNEVAVYATTGQKVFQANLSNNSGFYNKTLDLSNLNSGVYILQFTSGDYNTTKKIILK
jgi:hypothetical protein